MLLSSLDALSARRVRRAKITTHLQNADNSVGLCQSVGYHITGQQARYRKPLRRTQPPAEQTDATVHASRLAAFADVLRLVRGCGGQARRTGEAFGDIVAQRKAMELPERSR